jgi:hypothetical protein
MQYLPETDNLAPGPNVLANAFWQHWLFLPHPPYQCCGFGFGGIQFLRGQIRKIVPVRIWPLCPENLYMFCNFFSKWSNSPLITYSTYFLRKSLKCFQLFGLPGLKARIRNDLLLQVGSGSGLNHLVFKTVQLQLATSPPPPVTYV